MTQPRAATLTYDEIRAAAEQVLLRADSIGAAGWGDWPAGLWQGAFAAVRAVVGAPAAQAATLAAFGVETLAGRSALFAGQDGAQRARCQTLAAAVTELRACGRPGAAAALAALVAEITGDEALPPLLPFLSCLEALVACRLAADAGGAGFGVVRAYWRLALAGARTASAGPRLVVCGGLSGSGKSFVARGIGAQFGARVIIADLERKRLAGLPLRERTPDAQRDSVYGVAMSDRVYARLLDEAELELRAGRPVVLDATFLTRSRRTPALNVAVRLGVPAALVWCTLDEATAARRMTERAERGWTVSDGDAGVRAGQRAGMEEPAHEERGVPVFAVDGARPPALLFHRLLPRLGRLLRPRAMPPATA